MVMSGDLFGFPVSDLVPKSTEVSGDQLLTWFRFETQQQLDALVCVETIFLINCVQLGDLKQV